MRRMRIPVLAVLAAVFSLTAPVNSLAVDAPNWVAALHIAAQNAVGLRWIPVAGATEYKVLRSTTAGSGYEEIATTNQPQHFDKTIEPGTTYYYVLQAVAGGEASPNSTEKSVAIAGEKKVEAMTPPELQDIVLTQTTEFGKTNSKVGLRWKAPQGQVVAYNVYRSETAGSGQQMVTSTSELNYVDDQVEIGKTYHYSVSALDQNFQETPFSAEQSILIKEPEKKVVKKRKAKVKMQLRRCRLVREIKQGAWGALGQPTGVALNSEGSLFVSDARRHRVLAFDSEGEFLFQFGETGVKPGEMLNPLDIGIDEDDNIYVVMADSRVEIYNDSGVPKDTVVLQEIREGRGEQKGTIGGVTMGPDYWYFTDDKNHFIYVMEYGSNKVESAFGGFGKEPGQFRGPKKPYFDAEKGRLVIPDMFNFRIQIIDGQETVNSFGSYGNSVTQFSRVIAASADGMGNLLAVDFGNQTIQGFSFDGKFKYVLGTADGTEQLPIAAVPGIAFRDNRIYVPNSLHSKVQVWDLTDEIGPPVKVKKATK